MNRRNQEGSKCLKSASPLESCWSEQVKSQASSELRPATDPLSEPTEQQHSHWRGGRCAIQVVASALQRVRERLCGGRAPVAQQRRRSAVPGSLSTRPGSSQGPGPLQARAHRLAAVAVHVLCYKATLILISTCGLIIY